MSAPVLETHAGGVIRVTPAPGAWGAVPHALIEDNRVDLDSRAVAAWLATRPNNWQISIPHLQKVMGLGRERWWRIARELEAAGYLTRSKTPGGPGGRWVWQIEFCAVPTVHVLAVHGQDVHIERRSLNKKENPQKRERAPARPAGACPRTPRSGRGGVEIDEETGLHHNPSDPRDAAAMLEIKRHRPDSSAPRRGCRGA